MCLDSTCGYSQCVEMQSVWNNLVTVYLKMGCDEENYVTLIYDSWTNLFAHYCISFSTGDKRLWGRIF